MQLIKTAKKVSAHKKAASNTCRAKKVDALHGVLMPFSMKFTIDQYLCL